MTGGGLTALPPEIEKQAIYEIACESCVKLTGFASDCVHTADSNLKGLPPKQHLKAAAMSMHLAGGRHMSSRRCYQIKPSPAGVSFSVWRLTTGNTLLTPY